MKKNHFSAFWLRPSAGIWKNIYPFIVKFFKKSQQNLQISYKITGKYGGIWKKTRWEYKEIKFSHEIMSEIFVCAIYKF